MRKLIILLIKGYQKRISPNTNPKCKYKPTCSSYGLVCFEKFYFFKAFFLTLWRLLRCNPFSKGGFDPVPDSIIDKNNKRIILFNK